MKKERYKKVQVTIFMFYPLFKKRESLIEAAALALASSRNQHEFRLLSDRSPSSCHFLLFTSLSEVGRRKNSDETRERKGERVGRRRKGQQTDMDYERDN